LRRTSARELAAKEVLLKFLKPPAEMIAADVLQDEEEAVRRVTALDKMGNSEVTSFVI
jgi:hypothetical protein